MISREHRFAGRASLKFVYKTGRVVKGPFFSIRYIVNSRRQSYRAAVVVSRKISKSAVKRNRIRRRIYGVIGNLEKQIASPYDIVVTVFNEKIDELEPAELASQINSQLISAGILQSGK